jgi:hypothetical protein
VAMLGSLDGDDLVTLREYEAGHQARPGLLQAIDSVLARSGAAARS